MNKVDSGFSFSLTHVVGKQCAKQGDFDATEFLKTTQKKMKALNSEAHYIMAKTALISGFNFVIFASNDTIRDKIQSHLWATTKLNDFTLPFRLSGLQKNAIQEIL